MSTTLKAFVFTSLILQKVCTQNMQGSFAVWPAARMNSVAALGQIGFVIVADSGKIFRSTDFGMSWAVQENAGGNSIGLGDVCFTSDKIGYAVGGIGKILKTSDGGITWLAKPSLTSVNLEAVAFATPLVGIAVGGNLIIRTTNAGESWTKIAVPSSEPFHDVAFSSPSNGVIVASYPTSPNSQGFFLTNDSGKTWATIHNNYIRLGGVTSISKSKYIAVGNYGYFGGTDYGNLFRSDDGGSSWQIISSGTTTDLISVKFADSLFGIAVGYQGKTSITKDGGSTWSLIGGTYYSYSNVAIAFLDSIAILVADRGTPFRSTDKGLSWHASDVLGLKSPEIYPKDCYLSQNYPNPFNSQTLIKFGISENSFVKLSIFNILGNEVETLINANLVAGNYSTQWHAQKISSGVYFYRIQAGIFNQTKTLILAK